LSEKEKKILVEHERQNRTGGTMGRRGTISADDAQESLASLKPTLSDTLTAFSNTGSENVPLLGDVIRQVTTSGACFIISKVVGTNECHIYVFDTGEGSSLIGNFCNQFYQGSNTFLSLPKLAEMKNSVQQLLLVSSNHVLNNQPAFAFYKSCEGIWYAFFFTRQTTVVGNTSLGCATYRFFCKLRWRL
jgi:hypothetical protein